MALGFFLTLSLVPSKTLGTPTGTAGRAQGSKANNSIPRTPPNDQARRRLRIGRPVTQLSFGSSEKITEASR